MFKYHGKSTPEVEKLLKESIITLEWKDFTITNVIFNKVCPDCMNKLVYADTWYDSERVVIFKRLCIKCKKIFILSGCFPNNYREVKEYFINKFRMTTYSNNKEYYRK